VRELAHKIQAAFPHTARTAARARSDRPSHLCRWLCPGNEWATEGAERCCCLRASAASRIRHLCRRFGLLQDIARPSRTAMVRKGSPVRVRQRALGNRATTRFSFFRSGSEDHFRALPSEKRSSMAADGRCVAVCATAEQVLLPAQVTEAVHGRRGVSVATARESSARRSRLPSRPRSRVRGARVSAVASGESVRTRWRRARQVLREPRSGRLAPSRSSADVECAFGEGARPGGAVKEDDRRAAAGTVVAVGEPSPVAQRDHTVVVHRKPDSNFGSVAGPSCRSEGRCVRRAV
jgi:hypothetical protein